MNNSMNNSMYLYIIHCISSLDNFGFYNLISPLKLSFLCHSFDYVSNGKPHTFKEEHYLIGENIS